MRTVKNNAGEDRGAIFVWVAVAMVVLVGSGALVVDLGALYAERRQLQNGADAAALAVAMECAKGSCGTPSATARTYAEANAKDSAAAVDGVCGKGPGLPACASAPSGVGTAPYYVQVQTSTLNPGNESDPDEVEFTLAPILDALNTGSTVHARSTVAWGPLAGTLTTNIVPVAMSLCAFQASGGTIGSDGSLVFPRTMVNVPIADLASPCFGPGGHSVPGGFGWLDITSPCHVAILLRAGGVDIGSDPGKSVEQTCDSLLRTWAAPGHSAPVVIPIFDRAVKNGTNATYHIIALASFDFCSYRFPGVSNNGTDCRSQCNGPNNQTRVCGYFTPAVIPDGVWGPGTDYGTRVMKVVE